MAEPNAVSDCQLECDCEGWECDGDFNPAGVPYQHGLIPDRLSDTSTLSQSLASLSTETKRIVYQARRLISMSDSPDIRNASVAAMQIDNHKNFPLLKVMLSVNE